MRNGVLVADFDASTPESLIFRGVLPAHYSGGGLTLEIFWLGKTATTGEVVWGAAIEAGGTDLDSDSFATEQEAAAATTSGTSGIETKTTITFSSGANMDSLAAGGSFRLKLRRIADDVDDDMAGDAQLLSLNLKET